jgi:hypothetical protein
MEIIHALPFPQHFEGWRFGSNGRASAWQDTQTLVPHIHIYIEGNLKVSECELWLYKFYLNW